MHQLFRQVPCTYLLLIASMASLQSTAEPESQRIPLWPEPASATGITTENESAFITIFHPVQPNGAAIVICPGGGYRRLVTGPEGTGIAQWLSKHGITGIVLEYRLPNADPYKPLSDAQKAIRMVRANAANWKCDPARIGIMGFSAGGHLAATAATQFDPGDPSDTDPLERMSSRPDFAILIYPVITMGELAHAGSKSNLLGENPDPSLVERFSAERQITRTTPPTFLTHPIDDNVVSSENSQMFYDALIDNGVPATYLELPNGGHGLNGYKGPMWDRWQAQSIQWLTDQDLIPNIQP